MDALRLAFVAGEASGDLLAAPVIEALSGRGAARTAGVAGDRMIAAGCEAWHHVRELSVRGYAEGLRELPRLLALRRRLAERIVHERPAALVGVDAPDFNLQLETRVRRAGMDLDKLTEVGALRALQRVRDRSIDLGRQTCAACKPGRPEYRGEQQRACP